jgi:hypothetical protein
MDLLSISLDAAKNIIAIRYGALTNLTGFLAGLAKSPFYKFNSVKPAREAWQTRHAGIRVPSKYRRLYDELNWMMIKMQLNL